MVQANVTSGKPASEASLAALAFSLKRMNSGAHPGLDMMGAVCVRSLAAVFALAEDLRRSGAARPAIIEAAVHDGMHRPPMEVGDNPAAVLAARLLLEDRRLAEDVANEFISRKSACPSRDPSIVKEFDSLGGQYRKALAVVLAERDKAVSVPIARK